MGADDHTTSAPPHHRGLFGFRPRWEIYDGILARHVGTGARWLDAGCGQNIAIEEFPSDLTIGIDRTRHPSALHTSPNHFVLGDLGDLPFPDAVFTLVTFNMVLEHVADPDRVFAETHRVLAPGGRALILTTNLASPLIRLGRLVPDAVRRSLFTRWFDAHDHDIFPACHRANTLEYFSGLAGYVVEERHFVQDVNRANPLIRGACGAWHALTCAPGCARFRTNLIVLLAKT